MDFSSIVAVRSPVEAGSQDYTLRLRVVFKSGIFDISTLDYYSGASSNFRILPGTVGLETLQSVVVEGGQERFSKCTVEDPNVG